jgi:hypothetical protein
MRNISLTILGLGFLALSCTKKEKVVEKSTTDTVIIDSTHSKMPSTEIDTMKTSNNKSTSHHVDSAKSIK